MITLNSRIVYMSVRGFASVVAYCIRRTFVTQIASIGLKTRRKKNGTFTCYRVKRTEAAG